MNDLYEEIRSLKEAMHEDTLKAVLRYVKRYLSFGQSVRLKRACRKGNYDEVKKILYKAIWSIQKNIQHSGLSIVRDSELQELLGLDEVLGRIVEEGRKRGKEKDRMIMLNSVMDNGMDHGIIALIAVAVVIGIVLLCAVFSGKLNKKKDKVSAVSEKGRGSHGRATYTQKDADMMELIHELAEVDRNTEAYLKN